MRIYKIFKDFNTKCFASLHERYAYDAKYRQKNCTNFYESIAFREKQHRIICKGKND